MKHPHKLVRILLLMTVLGLLTAVGVSSQTGNEATPIPQETLDASIALLFQQTADAVMNQTATAVASSGGTATAAVIAAPTQTVEALFQQAMTATAQALTPSYDGYEVLDVQEFPLMAGPGRSGAHLSPDGMRFIHVTNSTACIYALGEDGIWAEIRCESLGDTIRDPEELRWSPDSRRLTLPTYQDAFQFFRDSDIRVFDTETFETIVLTEDNSDASPLDDDFDANYDISAHWLDEDTVIFLRYAPDFPEGGGIPFGLPHVMQVDITSGEPQELTTLPTTVTLGIYAFTVSSDGRQVAYSLDNRSTEPGQGIWIMNLDTKRPELALSLQEEQRLPLNLDFSITNEYLMLVTPIEDPRAENLGVTVLDITNKERLNIHPGLVVISAAWAPRGNGLAYLVRDPLDPEVSGLYITSQPGEPGHQVLAGNYFPATCCWRMPIEWADNDTILIGRGGDEGLLVVKVGEE